MQRTDWAEIFVEHFTQAPLTAECVFRSPKYLPADKELCDHILLLRKDGILVSLKCQEDPTGRTGDRLNRWAAKAARNGFRQAKVAIQRLEKTAIYCDHPRRGRVDFEANTITITNVMVVVEAFEPVELPNELPLECGGIPVTYISANDFLNMIDQLRAYPDIKNYLGVRRTLSGQALHTIGLEYALFEYYILNSESFMGCFEIQNALDFVAPRQNEIRDKIRRKLMQDRSAHHIEYVSDSLAKRNPDYRAGLDQQTLAGFDDPEKRSNYLILQEHLCDLPLSGRRMVGLQFESVINRVDDDPNPDSMCFTAVWTDTKPDFVYILISSKGVGRPELIRRSQNLLLGALAYYRKDAGMFVVDRDGVSYEVGLFKDVPITSEMLTYGEKHFGKLKITDRLGTLLPEDDSA